MKAIIRDGPELWEMATGKPVVSHRASEAKPQPAWSCIMDLYTTGQAQVTGYYHNPAYHAMYLLPLKKSQLIETLDWILLSSHLFH
jgi:hypothetical protein